MHHQHADRVRSHGDARADLEQPRLAALQPVRARHAEHDAAERDRLAEERAVGGTDRRRGVRDRAGDAREAEGEQHPPLRRGEGDAERSGREEREGEQDEHASLPDQAEHDDLRASREDARRGVRVGARAPVDDLVRAVGDETLDQHAEHESPCIERKVPMSRAKCQAAANRERRVAPEEHRDHADLEPDAAHDPHRAIESRRRGTRSGTSGTLGVCLRRRPQLPARARTCSNRSSTGGTTCSPRLGTPTRSRVPSRNPTRTSTAPSSCSGSGASPRSRLASSSNRPR